MNHPPNRPFHEYPENTYPGPEVNSWQGGPVGFPPGMTPPPGYAPAPPSRVGFPPGMTPPPGWGSAPPSGVGFPPGMVPGPGRGPGYAPPSTMPMMGPGPGRGPGYAPPSTTPMMGPGPFGNDDFDDDYDIDATDNVHGSFVPPWFPNSQVPPNLPNPGSPQFPTGGMWQQPMQPGPGAGPSMPPPAWGGAQPGMHAMPYGVSQHPYDASALKEAYNQMKLRHHHEEKAMQWAMNRAGIAMQLTSDDDSASTQADDSSVMSDSSSSI